MSDLLIRRRNLLIRKQEDEMNIRAVCFEADGEQTVAITKVGSAPAITMQYSYNGKTWDAWDLSALPFGGSTKVYVRGVGNARFGKDNSNYNKITFGTDAFVYVSGIVESLLDGDNEVLALGTQGILRQLFYQQTALRSAENLRFEAQSTATDIVSVYALMFDGCTNLLYAPKVLPANDFKGEYNYQYMFRNCTSLITAPELPATTLGQYCYQYMFDGCTSLVNAPELPATTLSQYCYQYMFQGCTSLLTAPKIMAMTTAHGSQKGMFKNCTSLVNAPELPATNLGVGCYAEMFDGCTSLVNAPELPSKKLKEYCYQAMFFKCPSLVDAPELPANDLPSGCYERMFAGCTALKTIRCRAVTKQATSTQYWLSSVSSNGTLYGHSEYGWSSGESGIPSGWTFEELTD